MLIRCLWQTRIRHNLFWTSCWRTSPNWWTSWANSKQTARRTSSSAMKRTISSSRYEISRGLHHRSKHKGQKNRTVQLGWWPVLCSWGNNKERMTNMPLSQIPFCLQLTSKMCNKNCCSNMCELSNPIHPTPPRPPLRNKYEFAVWKARGTQALCLYSKAFPTFVKHYLMDYFELIFWHKSLCSSWLWSLFYLWYKSSLNNYFKPFHGS